jgi:hypothetical protein
MCSKVSFDSYLYMDDLWRIESDVQNLLDFSHIYVMFKGAILL